MIYKGTNEKAFAKASKGRSKKRRSQIYYKEKNRLEKKNSLYENVKLFLLSSGKKRNHPIVKNNRAFSRTHDFTHNKTRYLPKQTIFDDIRDYKNSKVISQLSNVLVTSIVRMTCNNFTNDQKDFIRSAIALITAETIRTALEKPLNIIDNIKMFVKVGNIVYKVVINYNEELNEYHVDDSKISMVTSNDYEYLEFLAKHPKIKKIEIRSDIFDYLGKEVFVKIDRKISSVHPSHNDIIYSVNYGLLPNTVTSDGEEQDAYIIGVDQPIDEFRGIVKAIIIRKNDDEDKLIVCPKNKDVTKEEILSLTNFQEQYFDIEVVM